MEFLKRIKSLFRSAPPAPEPPPFEPEVESTNRRGKERRGHRLPQHDHAGRQREQEHALHHAGRRKGRQRVGDIGGCRLVGDARWCNSLCSPTGHPWAIYATDGPPMAQACARLWPVLYGRSPQVVNRNCWSIRQIQHAPLKAARSACVREVLWFKMNKRARSKIIG